MTLTSSKQKEPTMTKITLALLSTLAIGALTLPVQAQDWATGGNLAHASEGVPGPAANPVVSGGWAGLVTGEAGGSFDPRYATPAYGSGQATIVAGESGGTFDRNLAVRLGVQEHLESVLAALVAATQG